jgi:hypothetical protein
VALNAAEKQVIAEVAADLAKASTWISGTRSRELAGNGVKLQALLDGETEVVAGKRPAEALNRVTTDGTVE